MIYINNNSHNPYFNLAFEEYFFNYNFNDDCAILWQNKHTIVIGKNQNTWEELNHEFVKTSKINIVRRNSGGGAVYQDLGNINYSYITNKASKSDVNNYAKFTKPIIDALNNIGVEAKFSGRNDIEVNGKKISGNAQLWKNHKILHHGTILFDVNLDILQKALKPDLLKIKSKGIKSIRSRVVNIKSLLKKPLSDSQFKDILAQKLSENAVTYIPTKADIAAITELMNQKYLTPSWNYGNNPKFNIEHKKRFTNGTLETKINVTDNKIQKIKFYGDFLSLENVADVESKLINVELNEMKILQVLQTFDLKLYFGNISENEIITTIFNKKDAN